MGNSCVTGSGRSDQEQSQEPRAMGNSCVSGSFLGRSNQGQSQVSNEAHTTFKWTIDGFSSLLDKGNAWTSSSVFQIRGLNWYLILNPRDTKSGDNKEYVSLKLVLSPRIRCGTVVEASFKFLIYDRSYGKHHEEHQVSHNFQSTSTTSGTSCMIPLNSLKEKFLFNNCCVFGVDFITVAVAKGNDVSEALFVQKINSICSDPQAYNWNIDDFFVLKSPSTSPEFELCGHRWTIKIYPSGLDKNGNYLSLLLTMNVSDTLQENSAKLVEFSISIKGQETGNDRKLSGRYQFSREGACWGWDKFISLEDFKDPSNGYLLKTKCCIEAQVAVIGSSNME